MVRVEAAQTMSHNANEVLRSSRKLHSDLVGGTLLSNKAAAREVQLAIRNLPAAVP